MKRISVEVNRRRAQLRRWFDVFAYAAVGATIVLGITPLAAAPLRATLRWAAELGWIAGPIATVLIVACVWRSARGRVWAWLGALHPLTYPPTWLAGWLGAALVVAASPWMPTFAKLEDANGSLLIALLGWVVIIPASTVVANLILARRGRRHQRAEGPAPLASHGVAVPPQPLTDTDLETWLQTDDEIRSPEQDRFGHVVIARRIARRLVGDDDQRPTMAVIGDPGSGKSSVGHLVGSVLRSEFPDADVGLVQFSAWPYDSPTALVNGLLLVLTRELGKRVNTLGVVGVDRAYVDLMTGAGGIWSGLANLAAPRLEPNEVLERYDRVAAAIGLHVVLWIDDLERYSQPDVLPEDEARWERAVLLAPVRSLLFLLDKLESVSVVVASTSLLFGFDLLKLVRFIEQMPRPGMREVLPLVGAFRRRRVNDPTIVDPAAPEARAKLDIPEDPVELEKSDRVRLA